VKVVDIADELHRELGEPTSLSIPAIAFWLRTNIGALNNNINTSYSINATTFEVEQTISDSAGTDVTLEIAEEERSVLKKMYMVHFYELKLRENITSLATDTVISVSDDGSSVTKVNKNEINKVYQQIKRQEYQELKDMINSFKLLKSAPLQVAGNDTVQGSYNITVSTDANLYNRA
jgi:hypothetical protein